MKSSQLVLQHATLETCEDVDLATTDSLLDSHHGEPHTASELIVHSEAIHVIKTNNLKLINCEETVQKPEREQRCKKHSRCHCDLLSLDTRDFFTIKV